MIKGEGVGVGRSVGQSVCLSRAPPRERVPSLSLPVGRSEAAAAAKSRRTREGDGDGGSEGGGGGGGGVAKEKVGDKEAARGAP